MKKWLMILVLVVGLMLPTVASAATPESNLDFHPNADIDIWIDPLGWHRYWYTDLDAGDIISVSIDVVEGPGIDFFICDDENWDIWEGGGTASVYNLRENVGSLTASFTVPRSGTWSVVFDSDSLSNIHIEGTINAYTPTTTTSTSSPADLSLIAGAITLGLLLILLGMACFCAKKYQEGQQEGQQGYQASPQPSYQPVPIQKEEIVMFCSYCGTQRQSPDAPFCSRCGKAFSGPEFG